MATGRLPDPNSSPLTAKGDLYTYSTVPAKLAVGNNGDTLVADSSASTGLRWQGNYAAGKNAIINGDFRIWQRGTSFSNPSSDAYNTDRFKLSYDGTGATRTVSQQTFTAGTAPVAGYEGTYFYRCATTVAGTGNTLIWMKQFIEDVRTFAGQTVTLSFWAKADASRTLPNIGLEQYFGSGGSSSVYSDTANVAITTSWARYSVTVTLPSISGKTLGTGNALIAFIKFPTGVATIDIWGVQLEAGNTATAFQTATGTLAGELAACQRYYYKHIVTEMVAPAFASGTAIAQTALNFPVTMRVAPTITLAASGSSTGQIAFLNSTANYPTTIGTLVANRISVSTFTIYTTTATSAFTAGNASILFVTGTTQTVYEASAEL